jgi:hypothetical protein
MSSFFKRTIKCAKCGRPCQTIFVCPECFARAPEHMRKAFRRATIAGGNTDQLKQSMLSKINSGGSTRGIVILMLAVFVSSVSFLVWYVRTQPKPAAPVITPAPAVQWLGSPVVAQERATGHLTNVEFGIRDDGVVIWRDKRGPAVNGRRFGQFEDGPAPFLPIPPFTKAPNATAK